jgi:hypothetical protein
VLFRVIEPRTLGPARLLVPDLGSLDAAAAAIAATGALCLLAGKLGVPRTLAIGAGLGLAARVAGL